MKVKTYKAMGTEVQVLSIKNMVVKLKPGENAEELLDKLTNLIEEFSEEGNWHFKYLID